MAKVVSYTQAFPAFSINVGLGMRLSIGNPSGIILRDYSYNYYTSATIIPLLLQLLEGNEGDTEHLLSGAQPDSESH